MLRGIVADPIPVFLIGSFPKMVSIFNQFGWHFLDREHVIDKPGCGGALRHPAHGRVVKLSLGEGEASAFLDRF